jgi:hypothetical protein
MIKERVQLSLLLFLERLSEGTSTRVFAAASSDRFVRQPFRGNAIIGAQEVVRDAITRD